MDNVEHLPQVLGSGTIGDALPSGPEPGVDYVKASPEDLHLLKLDSVEKIQSIMHRYEALDVEKENSLVFLQHLTARKDAWFIEVGDLGLIYLTNITLKRDADVNAVFWDKRLTMDRRACIRCVVAAAFRQLQLPRLTVILPETNGPLRRLFEGVGFSQEGHVRLGWDPEKKIDAILMGMIAEEATWPVPVLTFSD